MTTKTIKTILFASLFVAMLLSFSGMTMAEATPNEDLNKKHMEQIRDGKIVLPGGHYIDRSELKGLDNDKSIEENAENGIDPDILMTHNGKTIFNLDAYKEKMLTSGELDEEVNNSLHGPEAYKTIAQKVSEDSITYFNGYWRVPEAPATYDGEGTIFIFNALTPFTGVIFQPILQYGNYGICGDVGETWVMAPVIFIDATSFNIGNCVTVETGDLIRGTISETDEIWTVEIQDFNIPDSTDSVQVGYAELADDAIVAMETYLLPENCDTLPSSIGFLQMVVGGLNIPGWVDESNPDYQWCDMEVRINSEQNVILINDIS